MKKTTALTVIILLLMGLTALPALAKDDKVELDLSLFIPEQHLRYQKVWKPWIEKIKQESGGRLVITPYFASALAPMAENLEAVKGGIADIGEYAIFTAPGRFPLTEVVMLPQLAGDKMLDSHKATLITNHLYEKFPEVRNEYAGVKLLSIHAAPVSVVSTVSKSITTVDDMKGLRLRTTGAKGAAIAKQLGFAAVNLPMGDMYLSMERGVVDGAFIGYELLVSRKWGEVLKHVVTNADFGADAVMCLVMNPESYNKLPDDLKKVIDDNSGPVLAELCGKTWAGFEMESLEEAQKTMGLQVSEFTPGELEKITKLMDQVKADYVKSLNDKGLPGTAVFEEASKMAIELTAGQ
jgi:TRAP-type transport system periplasmic protein